jgi:phospholipid-binding lipoprotein MlaA
MKCAGALILLFTMVLSFSEASCEVSLSDGGSVLMVEDNSSQSIERDLPDEEDDMVLVDDDFMDDHETESDAIYDPFEPFNRRVFKFNDRLYFLLLKPVASGYSRLVSENVRVGVRRFFSNITTPVRFVNALLQFKIREAGNELSRFAINTTLGLAGFMDPATERWKIYKHREDVGQTLGFYGAGPGVYMNLPFFGPSSLRDTAGLVGDILLDPTTYIFPHDRFAAVGVFVYDRGINETSLNIGMYEGMKEDALDPYVFIRDAYHQHRENVIRE